MSQHLPLTALRVFAAAGRSGSYSAAASELHLTPSAVSHAMRKLEGDLGTALFLREGRRMVLTAAGEVLLRQVERGFEDLRRGVMSVSMRGQRLLRVHCAPSFAAQWLAPRLVKFRDDVPGVEIRLAASNDYTRFVSDDFDADIVYGEPRVPGMLTLPLGDEVVAPLCSPELARFVTTPASLMNQSRIESDNKRVRWDAWFSANGLSTPPPNGSRFDRSFLAIAAAADGLGVALESLRLAERELASGRLVQPLAGRARDVRYTAHWIVLPPAKVALPALQQFIEWLADELDLPSDLRQLRRLLDFNATSNESL